MRITPVAVPLALAALLVSCQDANESNTDPVAPSSATPSALVFHERIEGGYLFAIFPEHGITLTVGLLTPIADLCPFPEPPEPFPEFESDAKIRNLEVHTPAGPIRVLGTASGTFVVYDAVVFNDCDLVGAPIIGTGRGNIKGTDNSITGEGPGMNSFGRNWTAVLDRPDGGKVQLHIVVRQLFDGVKVETIVDIFELKPLGP